MVLLLNAFLSIVENDNAEKQGEKKLYTPYPGKLHDLVWQKPIFSASLELLWSRATVIGIISHKRRI